MYKTVFLIVMLGVFSLALNAGLAWNDPVIVASHPNIRFNGEAATAGNGYTLISWAESIGEDYRLCVNLFDHQLQPLWPEPLNVKSIQPTRSLLVAGSDDEFIVSVWQEDGIYAHKITQEGIFPWGIQGVRISSFLGDYPKMVPDSAGGIWFAQRHSQHSYSAVQHVDGSGIRLLPETGLLLEPAGVSTYSATLYPLPDNGVVIAYLLSPGLRAKRLSATGTTLWDKPAIAPAGANTPRLCTFTAGSFALSWWDDEGLQLQRYEHGGNAVWPAPLCVFAGSAWPNAGYTRLLSGSEDCLFVSAKLYNEPLRLQKVSASGQLLFGQGTELAAKTFSFVSDNQGGCYAGSANGDIRLAHVSSNGEQIWGIEGIPVCVNGADQENLKLDFSNGLIKLFWMDWREGFSGVYGSKALPSGDLPGQENGESLRAGSYGENMHPRVVAMQDKSVLVWLQRAKPVGKYQLRMQIVQPDGSLLMRPEGLPLTGYWISENVPEAPILEVTPSQQIMVAWTNANAGICQAQLYSSNGTILWGSEAVTVSGIPYAGAATWLDGSFILVARKQAGNGSYRLWGQKIVNGTIVWPTDGLQLVGDDPANPSFSIDAWALSGDYLAWHRGQVWSLRFTADGGPTPGFNPWGNQISQTLPPYNLGSFSIRSLGAYLHCNWYETYLVHPSFDYWAYHYVQQVVSPQGDLIIEDPGIIYAEEGDLWSISDFHVEVGTGYAGFVSGYQTYGDYRLRYYALNGDLLYDGEYNLHNLPYLLNKVYYIAGLEDNKILLLCDFLTAELNRIGYVVVDPQSQIDNPQAVAVFDHSRGKIRALDVSRSGEDFHIIEAVSPAPNGTASILLLHKIVEAGSQNPNNEVHSPVAFSISRTAPNPFLSSMSIYCQAERSQTLELDVYNLRGQKIRSLFKGRLAEGVSQFIWDGLDDFGRTAGSGLYFVRGRSGNFSQTKKILKY